MRMTSIAALLLVIAGCGGELPIGEQAQNEKKEEEYEPIDVGRPCPEGSVVTYENFAESWLRRQCVACHSTELGEGQRAGAPLEVNLDTYPLVREFAFRIYQRAADDNDTMPPAGGPYPSDRRFMGDWLACQAPRESDLD